MFYVQTTVPSSIIMRDLKLYYSVLLHSYHQNWQTSWTPFKPVKNDSWLTIHKMAREAEISYDAHLAILIKDIAMMFV